MSLTLQQELREFAGQSLLQSEASRAPAGATGTDVTLGTSRKQPAGYEKASCRLIESGTVAISGLIGTQYVGSELVGTTTVWVYGLGEAMIGVPITAPFTAAVWV